MSQSELPLKISLIREENKRVLTYMSQLFFSSRWVWKEVIINSNGKIILPQIVSAEVDPKWGDTTVQYRYSLPPGKYIQYMIRIETLPKLSLYLDIMYFKVRFDEKLNAYVHDELAYYECIRDGEVVCNLKDLPKPIRKSIRINALDLPFSYMLM